MTSSIELLTAEMHVAQCSDRAAWALARAAACPWWALVRRACLVWEAVVHAREMDAWAAALYAEIRAEEFRYVDEDQAA